MKKIIFLSLLVLTLSVSVNFLSAQSDYNGFNLKDYYTPDIKRNALELNLDLYGDYTNINNSNSTNFSLNNTKIDYYRLINTRKKIMYLDAKLGVNFNYNRLSNDSNNMNFYDSQSFLWHNQIYYKPKYFFTYGVSLSHNGSYEKTFYDSKTNLNYINLSPSVGWGIGRIENVEDARQAIYILEALKNNDVLSRDLTKEEVFEFAQLISTVKNKRFLDSRLHRIDELTVLDNYLRNKNVLSNTDASYFTTLYDMWDYGALYTRLSGSQWTFELTPTFDANYRKSIIPGNSDFTTYINRYNMIGTISYQYSKPVKLNWQHDFYVVTSFGYNNEKDGSGNWQSYILPVANIIYTLNYYPSTRTNLYATIGENFSYQKYVDSDAYSLNSYTYLRGGANYYVSQNLRLSGNIALTYENDKYKSMTFLTTSNKLFKLSYAFSMTYLFF